MSFRLTVLGIAALYLAICLVLGLSPSKKSSASAAGYVAGDRSLGLFLMYFITGATVFSAFAFLGLPGWTYSRGAAAFYILGYGALGFVPFYFLGPRAARLGRARGYFTQAQMMADRFGSRPIAGVVALLSVIAFVPYLALQMKGAGMVIEVITEGAVPEAYGAAVVYAVVTLYVLRSGVLGVGWTNTFQGLFMLALAWGLGLYLPSRLHGGVGAMFERIAAERPELLLAPGLTSSGEPWLSSEYASAVIVSIVGFAAWPHLFMKAFTAKDERTIRRTVVLYPTFQLFLLPLFLIGFSGVFFEPGPESPDRILPHLLMTMELPAPVVGLFCAGALAASMSSGDAMVHAAASIAVRDGLVTAARRPLSPAQELRFIKAGVLLMMVASYLVAVLYRGSLVLLLLTTYGAVVQLMPGLVATLYVRRATGAGVLAGLLGGAAVTALFVVAPALRPWPIHAGAYGLVINLLLLIGVSAFTRRPADAEATLQIARSGRAAEEQRG